MFYQPKYVENEISLHFKTEVKDLDKTIETTSIEFEKLGEKTTDLKTTLEYDPITTCHADQALSTKCQYDFNKHNMNIKYTDFGMKTKFLLMSANYTNEEVSKFITESKAKTKDGSIESLKNVKVLGLPYGKINI